MSDIFLAIDTATNIASVAVGTPQDVRAVVSVKGVRQHAAQIVILVDLALQLANARVGELAGIVLGDGPGSFTGLRIGWAAAKGLAHERGIPLSAVPSLMGAAAGAVGRVTGPVATCFDALRGQVYAAMYVVSAARVETLVSPAVMTLPEFARIAPVRPTVVVGDGAVRYADEVLAWSGAPAVGLESLPPIAGSLLGLAPREGAARQLPDPFTAQPVYGRPAEAQARWEAHHGRPLPDPSGPAR